MADANGDVNSNGPAGDLAVQYGQDVAPKQTTASSVKGNLPAGAATGSFQTSAVMFDSQGVAQKVFYNFTKDPAPATDTWKLDVTAEKGNTPLLTGATVAFDNSGALTTPAAATAGGPATVDLVTTAFPGWTSPVKLDLKGLTQFGGAANLVAPEPDGYALGSLQSFQLGQDGTITGVYSNGLMQPLGKLAIASFNNPSGLEKAGSSSFRAGVNSGVASVGEAGAGGRGTLVSGALEMSNVDLAEEFTGLIVAQRGFQANSRVITTSDQVLEDLVNLKR
jgi:flagellar hook protein FlgE